MSISGFFKSYWQRAVRASLKARLARQPPQLTLERSTWPQSLLAPTTFYLDCVRFFNRKLPAQFQAHRAYFQNGRGFGENAFHAMWFLLLEEFKPANFLEIGVFRGQVISLVSLWAKLRGVTCEVCGISPFSGAGDSSSTYRRDLDYYQDTLQNFDHFALPHPNLLRASSLAPEATRFIGSRPWAMIYIDGNHDYEVARQDWEVCSQNVKASGIIVLDDAGLTTSFSPPAIATAGIAGPSQLAREIDRSRFSELLQVGHNRVFQKLS